MMTSRSIYEYSNFRTYLADWYQAEKIRRGKFTKGEVSRLLGLPNSRNYFSDLLGGKPLSETFQERLVELLGLAKAEAAYFRALVRFQQASMPDERTIALTQLRSLDRKPRTVLRSEQLEYFRHWRHGAIRALLDTGDYGDEPSRIAKALSPSVTSPQARASLKLLERLELISKNSQGFWKPNDRAVTAPETDRDAFILELQLQQLELVRKSLLTKKAPRRLVATNVLSISTEGHELLRKRLEEVLAEVRSQVHQDPAPSERVCQFILALVPLTQEKVPA